MTKHGLGEDPGNTGTPATQEDPLTCLEGKFFTTSEEGGKSMADWQAMFANFKDPVTNLSDPCSKCQDAKKMHELKCTNIRKRIGTALKEAGCPSSVQPYKKPKKKSCKKKKTTSKKKSAKSTKSCTTCRK